MHQLQHTEYADIAGKMEIAYLIVVSLRRDVKSSIPDLYLFGSFLRIDIYLRSVFLVYLRVANHPCVSHNSHVFQIEKNKNKNGQFYFRSIKC